MSESETVQVIPGPFDCPVCDTKADRAVRDNRGWFMVHARRLFGCRITTPDPSLIAAQMAARYGMPTETYLNLRM